MPLSNCLLLLVTIDWWDFWLMHARYKSLYMQCPAILLALRKGAVSTQAAERRGKVVGLEAQGWRRSCALWQCCCKYIDVGGRGTPPPLLACILCISSCAYFMNK